jgi:hypothetical protein
MKTGPEPFERTPEFLRSRHSRDSQAIFSALAFLQESSRLREIRRESRQAMSRVDLECPPRRYFSSRNFGVLLD